MTKITKSYQEYLKKYIALENGIPSHDTIQSVISLYTGHEIASHTLTHPYMDSLTKEERLYELSKDKANLENLITLIVPKSENDVRV